MRPLVYVLVLVFSGQVIAGPITGTIASRQQPVSTSIRDGHFWQLQTPLSPVEESPTIVLLEGDAAGQSEIIPQTFTIEGYGFEPKFAIVTAGSTIKLKNLDEHMYSCWATGANEFQFNDVAAGATVEQKLSSPGAMEIHCLRYPFMRLNLLVIGKAVFTTADARGNFAFKHVPAGDYQATIYSNGSFCCGTAVKVQAQPMQLSLSPQTKPQPIAPTTPQSAAPTQPPVNQARVEPMKPAPLNPVPSQVEQRKPEPGKLGPGKSEVGTPEAKPAPPKPEPVKTAPVKQATAVGTQPAKAVEPATPALAPAPKDKSPVKVIPEKKPKKAGGEAGDSLFKNVEPEIEVEE